MNALTENHTEAGEDPADFPIGVMLQDGKWSRIRDDGQAFAPAASFFDLHPIYSGIETVLLDGLELIRIPAFHIHTETDGSTHRWLISATPREGYVLHPAFRAAAGDRPHIHVGKYTAGKSDGPTFVLAAGAMPWTNVDFDTAAQACSNMGPRCRLWSIHDLSAVQLLMLVEMGHADAQGAIGKGNVNGHGPVGGGESDATWRGLCELWGNVWQMVDGLAVDKAGAIRVWGTGDPADGWIDTGVSYGPGTEDGYASALHAESGAGFDLSTLFLPSAVTDHQDKAIIPDWTWSPWGNWDRVAYCGGHWDNGRNAGPFALNLNAPRSYAGSGVGFRPAFDI